MSKVSRGICFCEVPRHGTSGLHCLTCEGSILKPDEPLKLTPDESVTTIATFEAIACPFCLDDDFDSIGLKAHISNGWCTVYNDTSAMRRPPDPLPLISPEGGFARVWHDGDESSGTFVSCRSPMKHYPEVVWIEDGLELSLWKCVGCEAAVFAGIDKLRRVVRRQYHTEPTEDDQ